MKIKEEYSRRTGETVLEYQDRLHTYGAGLIGLIEQYESEATLLRQRELLPLSKRLHGKRDPESVTRIISLIERLKSELRWYETHYPSIKDKNEISKTKKFLAEMLQS